VRKCVVHASAVEEAQLGRLEREVLQRLEVELDLALAMPPAGRGLKEAER